jgi:predicted nucleotidyltransferase
MTTTFQKRDKPGVTLRGIRRYARLVAERFQPDAIILFGSYAYGRPNAESDVDILVVMPARNQLDQAAKIRLAVRAPFAMDLLVRTPKRIRQGTAAGDSFTMEVLSKGKILYEKDDGKVGSQSRSRSRNRHSDRRKREATP